MRLADCGCPGNFFARQIAHRSRQGQASRTRDDVKLGLPAQAEYLAHYRACSGREQGVTNFHLAFSLFRFAVILEGISARPLAGNAAADDAVAVGALSAAFARAGCGCWGEAARRA